MRDGGPDHRVRDGAVVVLDPASGAILTMIGSPNFDDAASQGQVNAALASAAGLPGGKTSAAGLAKSPALRPHLRKAAK